MTHPEKAASGPPFLANGAAPSLRPYQTEAVKRVVSHFRATSAPAVVVLPTGSGKSLVIAELARLGVKAAIVMDRGLDEPVEPLDLKGSRSDAGAAGSAAALRGCEH